jgi:putative acetyltransferase
MKRARITKATQDRMPEVARVFRTSFRDSYPSFPELHTWEEDREHFTSVVFRDYSVFVAEETDTGAILGFIAFNVELVGHLYLVPEAQGRGLGRELLAVAKQGLERLQLWTFQQNQRARAFYRKQGFSEIRFTDGAATEEKQPDVLLEWRRVR